MPASVLAALHPSRTRRALFVSINRFERKKNVGLAIQALALLLNDGSDSDNAKQCKKSAAGGAQLVVAGAIFFRLNQTLWNLN